jgi:hypothetical protein
LVYLHERSQFKKYEALPELLATMTAEMNCIERGWLLDDEELIGWAHLASLAFEGALRAGFTPYQIVAAMVRP